MCRSVTVSSLRATQHEFSNETEERKRNVVDWNICRRVAEVKLHV